MKPVLVAGVILCIAAMSGCDRSAVKLALADRKMCAAQAEHVFASSGWSLTGAVTRMRGTESSGTFMSHYNARMRKCFMELFSRTFDTSKKEYTLSTIVTDVFEGTAYATYTEVWSGQPAHVRVDECILTVPNSPPKQCRAGAEWNLLVQPLIETGAVAQRP
jgi:hypothetical protein